MVKLITVIEVCIQTTQNHQPGGQAKNKDDRQHSRDQYTYAGEWEEGTEMQFCKDAYGQAQRGHEPGHAGGAAGFYCEVGGLEEAGGAEEVFVVIGAGCGEGGGGV